MKLRCPVCHSSNSADAYASDAAGRELVALLAGSGPLFAPLAAYLGCFRSGTRDLSHERALKLAKEVLELQAEPRALATALVETVEAMRQKRESGQGKPLTNHNYLKRVLESVAVQGQGAASSAAGLGAASSAAGLGAASSAAGLGAASSAPTLGADLGAPIHGQTAPRSKRLQGLELLADWAQGDWLRGAIAQGLGQLYAVGRAGAPAADALVLNATMFFRRLGRMLPVEEIDGPRIAAGFAALMAETSEWPEPRDLVARMPARPERQKLAEPAPCAEEIERGRQALAALMQGMEVPAPAAKENPEERRKKLREQARRLQESKPD